LVSPSIPSSQARHGEVVNDRDLCCARWSHLDSIQVVLASERLDSKCERSVGLYRHGLQRCGSTMTASRNLFRRPNRQGQASTARPQAVTRRASSPHNIPSGPLVAGLGQAEELNELRGSASPHPPMSPSYGTQCHQRNQDGNSNLYTEASSRGQLAVSLLPKTANETCARAKRPRRSLAPAPRFRPRRSPLARERRARRSRAHLRRLDPDGSRNPRPAQGTRFRDDLGVGFERGR